jgi:hypothetical protein
MRKPRRLAILVGLLAVALFVVYLQWKKGVPYQAPYVSPDGKFYVQKFSNFSHHRLMAWMPGQGSDAIDGYIRLYDKDGHLLAEGFHTFIRDIEPVWGDGVVYLKGVPSMDGSPWRLVKK